MIERFRIQILAEVAGEFSSQEVTLRADSNLVSVPPPLLPEWQVKDLGHSARSAGGRLPLNMHTPLTQQSYTMPLCRHSVGNIWK